MNRSLIIAVAACCGAAAFLWTLLARSPRWDRRSRDVTTAGARAPRMPGAMAMPRPTDLAGLEAFVKENPADYQAWFDLAECRQAAGDEAGARDAWTMTAKFAKGADPARGTTWFSLGWAMQKLGDEAAAREAFAKADSIFTRRLPEMPGNIQLLTRLGWARRGAGDEAGAREAWAQGEATLSHTDARDLDTKNIYNLACFRALLGKPSQALDALELAVEKGFVDADWAMADDDLRSIAHDPRFGEVVARMRAATPKPLNWQEPGGSTAPLAR